MGCVNSSVDNSKNKSLFTQDKYLEHLLNLISSKEELSAMLDPYFIKLIRKYLSKMVWPSDNRNTLVRLLEDYIRFSVHHTYTHTVIELTHYRQKLFKFDLDRLGKQFAKQIKTLFHIVKKRNEKVLENLQFYQNIGQFEIELNINDDKQRQKIHNLVAKQIPKISHYCQDFSYFYISLVLVKACRKLEKLNIPLKDINCKLQNLTSFVNADLIDTPEADASFHHLSVYHAVFDAEYNKYPSKKFKEDKELYETLNFLEYKKDKQTVLQDKIMELVVYAKRQYHYFETLLHKVCSKVSSTSKQKKTKKRKSKEKEECSEGQKNEDDESENDSQNQTERQLKINLKLKYRENTEALERIKQKILFKKAEKSSQFGFKSINQLLSVEKQKRKQKINAKLNQSNNLLLKINDLLRAKCLFENIHQLIETMQVLQQKIESQRRKLNNRKDIEIVEIDNRLKSITNDIVVKIKIGKIVTEFQMAISNKNFKSFKNQIYHIVYQISRSKTLSSISMLFDWHEKLTIKFVRFLTKIIKQKQEKGEPISNYQNNLYMKLMDNLYISPQLEAQLKKDFKTQKVAVKNDIYEILILNKILDIHRVQSLKLTRKQRTESFVKQLQGQEGGQQFRKESLDKLPESSQKKVRNNKIFPSNVQETREMGNNIVSAEQIKARNTT